MSKTIFRVDFQYKAPNWIKKVEVFHVNKYKYVQCKVRVTSLEQLCLAEFSGELARPKVYENGHKNVLGIWIN